MKLFLKLFFCGTFCLSNAGIVMAAHPANEAFAIPEQRPRPPHCDPWFKNPTAPTPTPDPEGIEDGEPDFRVAPAAAQEAYGDCDDDIPTPSPSPSPSPTPSPSGEPDDPNEQTFPDESPRPDLFIFGSGVLSCSLNPAITSQSSAATPLVAGFLIGLVWGIVRLVRRAT